MFILASCVVIAVATISLCQLHTRILDKYLPRTKADTALKPITEETNTLDTVQNFQFRWDCFCLQVRLFQSFLTAQHPSNKQRACQGQIYADSCMCCHTEIEFAGQVCFFTWSLYADTRPTSISIDSIVPGIWQGSLLGNDVQVTCLTWSGKAGNNLHISYC